MNEVLGQNILVIAAHPDDEVLGCGGLLLANASSGGQSHVLVVTEGSAAQHANCEEMSKKRHQQLVDATAILGVQKVVHWDYPDMELDQVSHVELNSRLHEFISEGRYQWVFVHHPHDVNLDHQVLYSSALVACRPTPSCCVKGMMTYHVNSSTEWGFGPSSIRFAPNCFIDIAPYLDKKLQAFNAYTDEIRDYPHPRSLSAIRDRARVYGSEVGSHAAEAFSLIYWRG